MQFWDLLHFEWAKIARAEQVQLLSPTPLAIIPKLHSNACDYLDKGEQHNSCNIATVLSS